MIFSFGSKYVEKRKTDGSLRLEGLKLRRILIVILRALRVKQSIFYRRFVRPAEFHFKNLAQTAAARLTIREFRPSCGNNFNITFHRGDR